MRIALPWLWLLAAAPAFGGIPAGDGGRPDDIKLSIELDQSEQSGHASASIRIHASPGVVWSMISECREALALVPGLVGCDVLQTAPDRSWQLIRYVVDYSWFVRKLTYEAQASYQEPFTASFTRVSGDLKSLNVSWRLSGDGEYTMADYAIDLSPGFWVPHWLVRDALRRDLPRMLRALRTRAESAMQR